MKILAIGDIHTKTQIIYSVADIMHKYDAVVFVGDYADDWKASPSDTMLTWNTLKTLHDNNSEKVHVLMGNHDYIYVNYTKSISSGYNQVTQLLLNSPENSELKQWIAERPITKIIDGVTYSHAGISAEWQDGSDLWGQLSPIWLRPYLATYKDVPQVIGHNPSETCYEISPNIWCIDTFSTMPNGTPIGDGTMLEVIDGKKFKKVKTKNDNNSTTSITS